MSGPPQAPPPYGAPRPPPQQQQQLGENGILWGRKTNKPIAVHRWFFSLRGVAAGDPLCALTASLKKRVVTLLWWGCCLLCVKTYPQHKLQAVFLPVPHRGQLVSLVPCPMDRQRPTERLQRVRLVEKKVAQTVAYGIGGRMRQHAACVSGGQPFPDRRPPLT